MFSTFYPVVNLISIHSVLLILAWNIRTRFCIIIYFVSITFTFRRARVYSHFIWIFKNQNF